VPRRAGPESMSGGDINNFHCDLSILPGLYHDPEGPQKGGYNEMSSSYFFVIDPISGIYSPESFRVRFRIRTWSIDRVLSVRGHAAESIRIMQQTAKPPRASGISPVAFIDHSRRIQCHTSALSFSAGPYPFLSAGASSDHATGRERCD